MVRSGRDGGRMVRSGHDGEAVRGKEWRRGALHQRNKKQKRRNKAVPFGWVYRQLAKTGKTGIFPQFVF
ncbi:hypothetical protein P8452_28015 [Trifolium repens]|nr:hypothetical protein P8452_28015 [Trifolium repens]